MPSHLRKCHIQRTGTSSASSRRPNCSVARLYIFYTFISSSLCRIAVFTMGLFSRDAICLRNDYSEKLSIKTGTRYAHGFILALSLIITVFLESPCTISFTLTLSLSLYPKMCRDNGKRKQRFCLFVIYEQLYSLAIL